MSQEYVRKKAAEALAATSGNRREAALLLRVWAEADGKLKSAITAPFLSNLCALAIQRAASSGRRTARRPAAAATADDSANLLAAIGSRSGETMTNTRARSAPPPPASSARHKQAVATLAAAFQGRKPKI